MSNKRENSTLAFAMNKEKFLSRISQEYESALEIVRMRSPEQLSARNSLPVTDFATGSGNRDQVIGNTRYIFAASKALRTRSSSGIYYYRVKNPSDGYAVPVDIADLRHPLESILKIDDAEDRDKVETIIYSRNLYTIEQFKEVMAWYCSAFFQTPEEAFEFLQSEWFWMPQANSWDDQHFSDGSERSKIKRKMRDFYLETLILPPVAPEFQYRDQVEAELIEAV